MSSKDQKKKKKPIQHFLAGGAAGLVESSVCHPLDTIKTRMQLRRQTTLQSRALGSLRDASGKKPSALHRTAGDAAAATTRTGSDAALKSETVRVKPDVSRAQSTAASANAAFHDVGWKQRVVPSASETATSTVTKAASTPAAQPVVAPLGPFGTARRIVQREGPLALYKGLTAVYTGIVPKMAIRFVSFEYYRDTLGGWYGKYAGVTTTPPPTGITFTAGLLSGLTEAILVVTPAEVCKIRMQSQYHSLMDPSQTQHAKYKNVVQTAMVVTREEGIGALWKGVVPTMLRQGCNQAVNFTVYNLSKTKILEWKKKRAEERGEPIPTALEHWQSLVLGGLSGGMGPCVNNPLDVVKTRMQKQVIHPGKEPKVKFRPFHYIICY
jgi:solute carrier family 25 citrate transporter 1